MAFAPRHELRNNMETTTEPPDLSSSIDALKFQISAETVPQFLENIREKLLSILHAFRRKGEEEAALSSFVKRTVNLSMKILKALEMADSIPRDTLEDFHQVLDDAKAFVAATSQWKFSCPISDLMDLKSSSLEQRLGIILERLKASFSNVQTTNSFGPSSGHNHSTRLFSNASGFTMNNANFFSASGSMFIGGGTTYPEGLVESPEFLGSLYVPHHNDLVLKKELHIGKGYRLHCGKAYGRVVVIKVFEGRHAEQLCLKTAELNRGVMHSNLLPMLSEPKHGSGHSMPRFLLFGGDCKGTVETELPQALMDGIQKTWIIGANTIVGCARALLYLENIGFPLSLMGPEHFVPIVSKEGKVVINFDVDPTLHAGSNDTSNTSSTVLTSTVIQIYNTLIQKTFYASCQKFYPDQRVYDDQGDEDINAPSFESEEEVEEHSIGSAEDSAQSTKPTTQNLRLKSKGHRRELIWKCPDASSWSLEIVAQSYEASLERFHSENALIYRRGHPTTHVAHRCAGYKRTEIIMCPSIDQSGVVSHTSPVPNEICSVCGERVDETEIFDCQCGSLNNDMDVFRPTIKCMSCLRWQHQDCMKISTDTQMWNYICWRCLYARTDRENFKEPSLI